jgi:uncharacterized protein YqgC (DUF456 family)
VRTPAGLLALALLVILGFLGARAWLAGETSLPLDDPFIYFQYARQAAHGEFLRYTPGSPRSCGATSLLYLFVCSAAYLLGFRNEGMILFTDLLGVVLFLVSTAACWHLGRRLGGRETGHAAALLFVLNGPLAWHFLSGMETGLFSTALLLVMWAWVDEGAPWGGRLLPWAIGLLALTRPEGIMLAAGVALLARLRARPGLSWRGAWLPVLAGILPLVAAALLTGHGALASFRQKSSLAVGSQALAGFEQGLRHLAYLWRTMYSGFGGSDAGGWNANIGEVLLFFAPGLLLLALIGLLPSLAAEWRERRFGVFTLGAWLLGGGTAISAAVAPLSIHWQRYAIPYSALILLFTAEGLQRLSVALCRGATPLAEQDMRRGLLGFLAAFGVLSVLFFALAYGENCNDIAAQHLRLARWMNRELPLGTVVGVNDAGALAYFGGRPILDLTGLVSPELTPAARRGTGALFEALERLPLHRRPGVFIIYPSWFSLEETGLLGPKIREAPLPRVTIAGSASAKSVYLADWSLAGSGALPRNPELLHGLEGWRLADELDVADVQSEAEHHYERLGRLGRLMGTEAYARSVEGADEIVLADGGRGVIRGERFRMKLRPGRPALIVARSLRPWRLLVRVDGNPLGTWRAPRRGQAKGDDRALRSWIEGRFPLPPEAITSPAPEIELRVLSEDGQPYGSFHYWVYQP